MRRTDATFYVASARSVRFDLFESGIGRKHSGECLPIVTRSHPARFIASFIVEPLTASSS